MKNSDDQKATFELFPKDSVLRFQDALFYLVLFGTFGVHQFYLGNKKRAYYLLTTCGTSHLMLALAPKLLPLLSIVLAFKIGFYILFVGYAFGAPLLLWDFITLPSQVRSKNGQANFL